MVKLRLSTEGRFMLSGFSPEAVERLRFDEWIVAGDLQFASTLVLVSVKRGGLKLSKDGRLHVAGGQKKFGAFVEMELLESVGEDIIKLKVMARESPSVEKIRNMAARPVKPPGVAKQDPNEMHLFEDLQ